MSAEDEEISILDLLITIGEEKKLIAIMVIAFTAFAGVAAALYTLTLAPSYTARTVMLPPQQQQSSAATALAGLGALAGGIVPAGGLKSTEELYLKLFSTESLQNSLIERLKLRERYRTPRLPDARDVLSRRISLSSDRKTGLITIEADDHEAEFAAELANAHVDELRKLLGRVAVTEAQQRRAYFEAQIAKTKEGLTEAERRFREAKDKSGIQVTQSLLAQSVGESAALRGQISAREVQLQSMRTFAASENPDVRRLADELTAMRAQLARIEQGSRLSGGANVDGQAAVEAFRDVKIQESMLEGYFRQLELARADEAREGPVLQQVDVAAIPDRRSKPNRRRIVQSAGIIGLFVGLIAAFIMIGARRASKSPQSREQMGALKRAWSLSGKN